MRQEMHTAVVAHEGQTDRSLTFGRARVRGSLASRSIGRTQGGTRRAGRRASAPHTIPKHTRECTRPVCSHACHGLPGCHW